jgi:hypothetical protein
MQARLQLLHEWTHQLQSMLPELRVSTVRVLALLSLGLLWAECVALGRIAVTLPCSAHDLSTEKRLQRWIRNHAVPVVPTWQTLAQACVARLGQRELQLIFDPTPHTRRWTLLVLGIVVRGRVLPLAWHIVPATDPWRHDTWTCLARLCRRVARIVPPDTTVTLVVDRGLVSAAVVDLCRELGWHYVLRLSVDARQGLHVRLADGTVVPAWSLVRGPGSRWQGAVETFQAQGWRTAQLTITWPRRYDEPWLLLSDRPAGPARVREYRRRVQVEACYQDCKRRGFDLEASHIRDRNRINRLLLALYLALWWCFLLGATAIRRGLRRHFDRADRRDLSLMRLGRRWMKHLLDHGDLPPVLFRFHNGSWTCRWSF